MQNDTYANLVKLIQALIGAGTLTLDEHQNILQLVNRRLTEAYGTTQDWPRYLVVGEERTFTTDTQVVPYSQTNKDNIGEFLKIHRQEPYKNLSALEYDFFITNDGANVLNVANADDSSVFVTYKKELDLVSITETTPTAVVTDYTGNQTSIPKEFFYYIAHAVYADFLRIERRYEQAIQEEALAQNYLAQELEKLDIIANNNNLKKKFSTHLNRNYR